MNRNGGKVDDVKLERQQRIGFKKHLEDVRNKEASTLVSEEDEQSGWFPHEVIEHISMTDVHNGGYDNKAITINGFVVSIREHELEKILALMPDGETFIEGTGQGNVYIARDVDDYAIIESAVGEFSGKIDFITLVNLLEE